MAGFSRMFPEFAEFEEALLALAFGGRVEAWRTRWTMPVQPLEEDAVVEERTAGRDANVRCCCHMGPRRGRRNRGMVAIAVLDW